MTDIIKTTNRGGARKGAGRPSEFGKGRAPSVPSSEYKVSINVLKELEKMDRQLKKGKIDETQLAIIKTRVDILNKLLPYVEHKKPVASLNSADEGKIPTHTILSVINTNKKEIIKEEKVTNTDESDFV